MCSSIDCCIVEDTHEIKISLTSVLHDVQIPRLRQSPPRPCRFLPSADPQGCLSLRPAPRWEDTGSAMGFEVAPHNSENSVGGFFLSDLWRSGSWERWCALRAGTTPIYERVRESKREIGILPWKALRNSELARTRWVGRAYCPSLVHRASFRRTHLFTTCTAVKHPTHGCSP